MRKTSKQAPRGAGWILAPLMLWAGLWTAPVVLGQEATTFGSFKQLPKQTQLLHVDLMMHGMEVAFEETAGTWPSKIVATLNGCRLWPNEVHAALLKKTGSAVDATPVRLVVFDTYREECAAQKRAKRPQPQR